MQSPEKAVAFYDDKVKGLDSNLQELEKIVQSKSSQLRVVEEGEYCVSSEALWFRAGLCFYTDYLQSSDRRCSVAMPRRRRLLVHPRDRLGLLFMNLIAAQRNY